MMLGRELPPKSAINYASGIQSSSLVAHDPKLVETVKSNSRERMVSENHIIDTYGDGSRSNYILP